MKIKDRVVNFFVHDDLKDYFKEEKKNNGNIPGDEDETTLGQVLSDVGTNINNVASKVTDKVASKVATRGRSNNSNNMDIPPDFNMNNTTNMNNDVFLGMPPTNQNNNTSSLSSLYGQNNANPSMGGRNNPPKMRKINSLDDLYNPNGKKNGLLGKIGINNTKKTTSRQPKKMNPPRNNSSNNSGINGFFAVIIGMIKMILYYIKKIFGIISDFCLLVVLLYGLLYIPQLAGYKWYSVLGENDAGYNPGTLIYYKNAPAEEIIQNDIIVYKPYGNIVVHKVISAEEKEVIPSKEEPQTSITNQNNSNTNTKSKNKNKNSNGEADLSWLFPEKNNNNNNNSNNNNSNTTNNNNDSFNTNSSYDDIISGNYGINEEEKKQNVNGNSESSTQKKDVSNEQNTLDSTGQATTDTTTTTTNDGKKVKMYVYETKGDFYHKEEPNYIQYKDVVGKVSKISVPFAGYYVDYVNSNMKIFFTMLAIVLLDFLISLNFDNDKKPKI